MLDLIIPVYNNREGLCRTLMSIGTETEDPIYITVVDDGSTETYDDIIEVFAKFFPIRLLTLEENSGPGIARQHGLDNATQKYVSFIDCGDTFCMPTTLQYMLNTVKEHDDCIAYFWSHTEEYLDGGEGSVGNQHNRMHGKIYDRQWLLDNNIHFSAECPRANEDIGFNLAVRLIDQQYIKDNPDKHGLIYLSDNDVVRWVRKGPSIVRANDCEYYYHQQNMGLALNAVHAFNIAKAAGAKDDVLVVEANCSMAHEYLFYMSTKANRPEYTEDALAGALYFYQHLFRQFRNMDQKNLMMSYYRLLGEMLNYQWNPIHECHEALDYLGFIDWLEQLTIEMEKIDQQNNEN